MTIHFRKDCNLRAQPLVLERGEAAGAPATWHAESGSREMNAVLRAHSPLSPAQSAAVFRASLPSSAKPLWYPPQQRPEVSPGWFLTQSEPSQASSCEMDCRGFEREVRTLVGEDSSRRYVLGQLRLGSEEQVALGSPLHALFGSPHGLGACSLWVLSHGP